MEEPQRRKRTILSDQISSESAAEINSSTSASIAAASSNNLRNLLTVRQEEDLQPLYQRRGSTSVSLGTVIACEKRDLSARGLPAATSSLAGSNPTGGSRTLLDIIRDEESVGGAGRFFDDGFIIRSGTDGHNISWRAFKDRLRIRRASAAWQSPAAAGGGDDDNIPASDHVLPPLAPSSRNATHSGSLPEPNAPSSVPGTTEAVRPPTPAPIMGLHCAGPSAAQPEHGGPNNQGGASAPALATYGNGPPQHPPTPQPQQIRVSLMALLEQTDRQMEGPGFAVSALLEAAGEAEAEEEEEEEAAGGGEGGKMYKCCVCMVRHKGAAFIPCGHTFCRLCSRELWVSRGNCPLCNGFILEILDIF